MTFCKESTASGLVKSGIKAISQEESFTMPSQAARNIINTAKEWTEQPGNNAETTRFEENLTNSIESCFKYKGKIPKKQPGEENRKTVLFYVTRLITNVTVIVHSDFSRVRHLFFHHTPTLYLPNQNSH